MICHVNCHVNKRRIKVPHTWCSDRVYLLPTSVKQKPSPFKHSAVQLCSEAGDQWFGQGQLLLPSFIATQRCLCKSVMVFCLQPPRLTCSCAAGGWSQCHLPWRKEQTSGLGVAPSSLYVNKAECFLSEIREQYVCRKPSCEAAGHEDVKPCQPLQGEESGCWVGSQGVFLRPERFLPFSHGHPSTHSPPWPPKAPLSFTAPSSELPQSPGHAGWLGTLTEPPPFAGASWLRHIQHPASPRSI